MEFHDISEFVRLGKEGIDLVKAAVGLMPKGASRDAIEKKVAEAEAKLARSDAKLAKELGYHLCECTFPPQPMLWREKQKAFVCPNPECGQVISMSDDGLGQRPAFLDRFNR